MRKILMILVLFVSLKITGQDRLPFVFTLPENEHLVDYFGVPANYTNIFGRYRWIAGMFDSSFHIPRYNGVPSGLRVGSSNNDGLLASDTLNGHPYHYWNLAWHRIALYADLSDMDLQTVTDNGNTTTNQIIAPSIRDASSLYLLSTIAGQGNITLSNGTGPDHIRPQAASTGSSNRLPFTGNVADTLATLYDIRQAGGGGGGSGTVNTGAALKAAYYPSAAALVDDWVGVEFGNTNLNTKITAQATTEVGLEIKLASTPTANALNISSNSGTGDLASFTKDGYLNVPAGSGSTPSINLGNVGLFNFGNALGIYTQSFQRTVIGDFGLLFREGTAVIQIGRSGTLGGTNRFSISAPAVGTMQLGMESTQQSMIFKGSNNSGTDQAGFSMTLQDGGGTGNSTSGGGVIIQTADPIASGTGAQTYTSKFQVNKNGSLKANLYGAGTFTGTPARYPAFEADGDIIEVTASSLKASLNKGVFIQAPTSADIVDVWQTPVAITVTSLKAILRGTSPSVTYNVRFGTDITSATTVFTSDITCTSITTGCSNSSGFNDATIPAGSFIWIFTTAASGTINSISFTINYTED